MIFNAVHVYVTHTYNICLDLRVIDIMGDGSMKNGEWQDI